MPETLLFEKVVTLKEGTIVTLRERVRDEGTILLAFLQYLMKKLADQGELDYLSVALESDRLFRTVKEKYIFIVDAYAGKDQMGFGIIQCHPLDEESYLGDVSIFVKKKFRSKGLGKRILDVLLEYGPAKIPSLQKLMVKVPVTNEIAAGLCIKAGFAVHGILPGYIQSQQKPIDQLLFVRDLTMAVELLAIPEEGRRPPSYFPHWHETDRERKEKLMLIGFLSGFDIEQFDKVDESGIWDWASRFALALADRDPGILEGRTRVEYLKNEALRLIPLRYLRAMARGLGYIAPL